VANDDDHQQTNPWSPPRSAFTLEELMMLSRKLGCGHGFSTDAVRKKSLSSSSPSSVVIRRYFELCLVHLHHLFGHIILRKLTPTAPVNDSGLFVALLFSGTHQEVFNCLFLSARLRGGCSTWANCTVCMLCE
jgi:hypothetical protein